MEELTSFKTDLEQLKTQRSHIQIKMEESVNKAKQLKETLSKMGYANLQEAKDAYSHLLADAEHKHAEVKGYIDQIKHTEATIPSKDEILQKLKEEAQVLPPQETPTEPQVPVSEPKKEEEAAFEGFTEVKEEESSPTPAEEVNLLDNLDMFGDTPAKEEPKSMPAATEAPKTETPKSDGGSSSIMDLDIHL